MKPFISLCKIEFIGLLNAMNMLHNKKKKRFAAPLAALLATLLMAYIGFIFSLPAAEVLVPLQLGDMLWTHILMLAFIMSFSFTFMGGTGMLFNGKDIDFLFSLPLPHSCILLSKMLALYLENFLFCSTLILSGSVAYALQTPLSLSSIISLILICISFPILITLLCALLGFIVSFLSSLTPYKNFFSVVFTFLGIFALFGGLLYMKFSIQNETQIQAIRDTIWSIVPPLKWVATSLTGESYLGAIWVLLLSILSIFVFLVIFTPQYQKIVIRLSNRTINKTFVMTSQGASSCFSTLLKKESTRFFTTPTYLLNCGLCNIFLILQGGYFIVKKDTVQELVGLIGLSKTDSLVIFALVILFFNFVSPTSVVSLSLEGNSFWILKTAPISVQQILLAKITFGFLVLLPGTVVSLLGIYVALQPSIPLVLALLASLLLCNWSACLTGCIINLHFPKMDAPNDTVVIKQSGSVLIHMLATMVIIGVSVGGYFLLSIDMLLYYFIWIFILTITTIILHLYLSKNATNLFHKI